MPWPWICIVSYSYTQNQKDILHAYSYITEKRRTSIFLIYHHVSSQPIVILQTTALPVWASIIQSKKVFIWWEKVSPKQRLEKNLLLFPFSVRIWCQQHCRTTAILLYNVLPGTALKVFEIIRGIHYLLYHSGDHCGEQKSTLVNNVVQRH